ncbi:NACHT, LRR and PYD domains-containing protein 3-like [Perca flavescens]|uniref:NACHT, LRR and PYD domains-containing protein 3-like n=1 Tax=Perca flavescens TaxID=8167 RepID=UPI00106DE6A9|nr:NACHT, LRR and PYD domains-containing protein 3-like [Perca flavescens]
MGVGAGNRDTGRPGQRDRQGKHCSTERRGLGQAGDAERQDDERQDDQRQDDEGQDDERQDDEGEDDEGQDDEGQDDERQDDEGEDDEGQDDEGQDDEVKDDEGQDDEGEDDERQDDEGEDDEGQDDEGQDDEVKDDEGQDDEGEDDEGQDDEGQDDEVKDDEGQDDEGEDDERQDDEGEDDEGQDDEGQDDEGKDDEGQDDEGQDDEGQDDEGQDDEGDADSQDDEGQDDERQDDERQDDEKQDDEGQDDERQDDERQDDERQDDERQDDERDADSQDDEGQDDERQDDEGQDDERQDDERQDYGGQDDERQDDERQDDEGQDDERQDDEGQDDEGDLTDEINTNMYALQKGKDNLAQNSDQSTHLLPVFVARVGGVSHIFLVFRVLVAYRSWSDSRLQPITISGDRMMRCSLPQSLAVIAAYQMIIVLLFGVSRLSLFCLFVFLGFCLYLFWICLLFSGHLLLGQRMETPQEVILGILEHLGTDDFENFKWYLQQKGTLKNFPAIRKSKLENVNRVNTVDTMFQNYSINTIKVTRIVLVKINQNDLVEKLSNIISEPAEILAACQQKVKSNLHKTFQCVFEGIAKPGNPTILNKMFAEIYITEEGTAGVNAEHDVRQIEIASWKPDRPETTITYEDIFKARPGREPIRTVMTKGVAGIGKTVLTQKFTLDWAEGKANQDMQFTFPFTFRELNVLKEKKYSLMELVHHFFSETKEAGICRFEEFPVVFIFDGLDECRLPLDFHNTEILTDVTESTSVDVLLTNLIRGKLLPSAHLWITTRPAGANQIPPDCVDMVTEVRGFTNLQKEEYFRKRFRDEDQADRIISHIKTSRSLNIMCHIPVFCWITATVLEDLLKTREGGELPKTLTEMYIHFLVVQSKQKDVKYDGGAETDPLWSLETRKMIESLGKLAFEQLQKGNLIFYESDLTECGINITAASVYSGVFTQIFKEERVLYQDKVFTFIHLSVQEFLAALHVHLTFTNSGVNLLSEEQTTSIQFYQSAVDKALQSMNGHLDLFLRFLMGLSLETNQTLLRGLLTKTGISSQTNQETVEYIKKKINGHLAAERSINLFHCLNELNDHSLVEQIQRSLSSESLSVGKLSPAQWSALVFILLSSEVLDVFDLKKYKASEEALLRLLPVVKASKKAV